MSQSEKQTTVNTGAPTSRSGHPRAILSLGRWNFYFGAKFLLFWNEAIGFHFAENLAFAVYLLVPVTPAWRRAKQALAIPFAAALLYYDSWLPPIGRALSQLSLLSSFDAGYLVELAGRFVNVSLLAMLLIAWLIYRVIARWVRFGLIVVSYMATMTVLQLVSDRFAVEASQLPSQTAEAAKVKPDFDNVLKTFYAKESNRSVTFPPPSAESIPFDVVFIHVCSLSWDDVRAVGLDQHPLWKRFDFLFTNFNSAASYSGPAAIRIQRAACGQSSNDDLYRPAGDQCYLMGNLKRSGFEPNLVMNHDGHFDDFLKTVQAQRLDVPPMPLDGTAIAQYAFDGAPIYDDLSVLRSWLDRRGKSGGARVALYYNSISLHDGNRMVGANSKLDSVETYKIRLSILLDELEKFMGKLERSGQRAVVAMIPEHGAAVQGDKMQIPGLREIPSPRITLVPVGIKVIGAGAQRKGGSLAVEGETSYLAVSQVIARMMEISPFTGSGFDPADYVEDLPVTPFVSQNDSAVVVRHDSRYYWRQDGEWGEFN